MKLPSWPVFDKEQIDKTQEILESGKVNYWTGNEGKEFEKEFSRKFDSLYSVALANGSLALSCAYLALNLKKGDEIITTPRTFIATSSSAVLLGLKPVFVDVDLNSGAITAESILKAITNKTKAIVVVHLGGWPADMVQICSIAKEYSIPIIEDCSQAHGAKLNGKNVGTYGDIATWSFCQDKIITTGGEGGMLSTNNFNYFNKVWSFKDHGKSRELILNKSNSTSFKWVHNTFGSNFRLTEIQSSIGRIQLKMLDEWVFLRNRNAKILINYLNKFHQIRIPIPSKEIQHAYYKFYCYVEEKNFRDGWNRDRFVNELNKLGFPAFSGTCSQIYLEKCFENIEFKINGSLKNATKLGSTSLMFLVHPNLTTNDMHIYADKISSLFEKTLK